MAKRPSVAVEHQADVYRELSDDAIARLYTKEQLTALPSMTIRDALAIVMKECEFSVKLSTQYKIVKGV